MGANHRPHRQHTVMHSLQFLKQNNQKHSNRPCKLTNTFDNQNRSSLPLRCSNSDNHYPGGRKQLHHYPRDKLSYHHCCKPASLNLPYHKHFLVIHTAHQQYKLRSPQDIDYHPAYLQNTYPMTSHRHYRFAIHGQPCRRNSTLTNTSALCQEYKFQKR